MARKLKWVRSGSIIGPSGAQIDLCTEDETRWLTIKTDNDRAGELLCTKLLRLLNGAKP